MKLRKNIEVHAVDARAELWRQHDERAYGQVEEQVAGTLFLGPAEEILLRVRFFEVRFCGYRQSVGLL